ncbi:class II glutamine amidotransferase [Streptomyces sp. NBC_01016]|uniref:class II glutamine amidotransferase n=1 Tax=Streptomyces sp. NBC_01016 TaxID=2903720 RepID=UPI00224E88A2|nr:class II glutamine amidotransferase [Streptomyces sp. NBC_01016]MCX4834569.1 class II glutamine amidotransferase [Streptomyces sp. NBC_01016]
MCRLFALTTCGPRVQASHWLLDSLTNFAQQSTRQPDGTGLGWFSLGNEPVRDRSGVAAFENDDFAAQARNVVSHTIVSHIRYATAGQIDVHNTHPFDINDRLFAHNGCLRGAEVVDGWLSDVDRAHVEGTTDSELVFAYISAEIRRTGDTAQGIISAISRIAAELPVFSLNFVLAEADRLWALRYPHSCELWLLDPEGGGFASGTRGATEQTAEGSVPAWVIASERLDDDPDWRLLEPGELLCIQDGKATSQRPFAPPAQLLTLDDMRGKEIPVDFEEGSKTGV